MAKCLRDASLKEVYGCTSQSVSSSPEDGPTIANGYFHANDSSQTQCDDKMCQIPGIAASMPVDLNFTSGSAPQPVGGSFEIHPMSSARNTVGWQNNVAPQLSKGQSVRMGNAEGTPLSNPNATTVLSADSFPDPNQAIPGLAPYAHHPNGATISGEDSLDSLHAHVLRGFPDTQDLDQGQENASACFQAQEQEACGNSWASYDFIDEFSQANGGPDINLAYFFDEHE